MLASIAERYSAGLVAMRAFVTPLHHMVASFGTSANKRATKPTTSAARFCIEVWRAVALLLFIDREAMQVPMRHMAHRQPPTAQFALIADAGPDRIGAGILSPSGALVAYTSLRLPFGRNVLAKYQNLREFLGLLVNLVLLFMWLRAQGSRVQDPTRDREVLVRWNSDSTAAISWVDKMKCNSRCGQHASFALTWFQLQIGVRVTECVHISGEDMIRSSIDALSRGYPTPELDPGLRIDLDSCTALTEVLRLCDPSGEQNLVDHRQAFADICSALGRL